MQNKTTAYLIIEKGEPYNQGDIIPIHKNEFIIGRKSETEEQDLIFFSHYISRCHLKIKNIGNFFIALDLESKNRTKINNILLLSNAPYKLKNGDRIQLAENEVVLTFKTVLDRQAETPARPVINDNKSEVTVTITNQRKEILINSNPIELNGKLYLLFMLLYENRGKVVSLSEIRKAVWTERTNKDFQGIPCVFDYELTRLIERLRKKLGLYKRLINVKRGFGYILEIE
jgi:DNA-binding winged helix-turn-helix (wHTH) protein